MANQERQVLWKERVAQWRDSGQSQRTVALSQGFPQRQLNYWARRLSTINAAPALLPLSPGAWTRTLRWHDIRVQQLSEDPLEAGRGGR